VRVEHEEQAGVLRLEVERLDALGEPAGNDAEPERERATRSSAEKCPAGSYAGRTPLDDWPRGPMSVQKTFRPPL